MVMIARAGKWLLFLPSRLPPSFPPSLPPSLPFPIIQMTYGELNEKIGAVAAYLQHAGLKPGQCVSVFAENSHR
jgi:acyl-CoA synthetase (AMP-forming)/AMP-acid ligase II